MRIANISDGSGPGLPSQITDCAIVHFEFDVRNFNAIDFDSVKVLALGSVLLQLLGLRFDVLVRVAPQIDFVTQNSTILQMVLSHVFQMAHFVHPVRRRQNRAGLPTLNLLE